MQNKKAFTLIEVMVVMAIIAVLAVLIIGAITLARRTATETTQRSNAKTIQTALEAQYAKYKEYCGTATGEASCTVPTTAALWTTWITAVGGGTALSTTATTCNGAGTGTGAYTEFAYNGVVITNLGANTYTLRSVDYACNKLLDTYSVQ